MHTPPLFIYSLSPDLLIKEQTFAFLCYLIFFPSHNHLYHNLSYKAHTGKCKLSGRKETCHYYRDGKIR